MTRHESALTEFRRSVVASLLLTGGLALIAGSFIWSSISTGQGAWSVEQAKDYQAASVKLHGLSHELAHAAGRGDDEPLRQRLQTAQAEYDALREQLDSAMEQPKRIAFLLRLGGLVLIAATGMCLFWRRVAGVER